MFDFIMAFFTNSVTALKTVVTAIGAGVAVWGIINLLEGYGNDNPGAKSQGIKHVMANKLEHESGKEEHGLDTLMFAGWRGATI